MKKEKMYVIELWDRENDHVYLATGEDNEILKFEFKFDGEEVAKGICQKAYREYDREYSFFVTQHPHKLAEPLK
jgi:Holliday junction resolvase